MASNTLASTGRPGRASGSEIVLVILKIDRRSGKSTMSKLRRRVAAEHKKSAAEAGR